jgi:hypothetical protein
MKTKNQTEHSLLELAINKAANEDGFSSGAPREVANGRKPSWSPLEVWRTRVKTSSQHARTEPAQA